MNNPFKVSTDCLVEMARRMSDALQEGKASMHDFEEMKTFIEFHFDELNLSPLLQAIRAIGREREFNAFIALLNKYLGMSKKLIPFELKLQDYTLADKIMYVIQKQ